MLTEWTAPLRAWQAQAFKDFQRQTVERSDYLLVATPGSGKTRLALRIAHWLFERGQVERLIVVTPTSHLRKQWADEAARLAGIRLDPEWQGPPEHEEMHGMALTYQMVAFGSNCNSQRYLVGERRTLVILDEIHHAGEQQKWGESIQKAYELAEYRLLLSGTPFRSDNFPIAFVNYDTQTRECVPDCSYTYGDSLQDEVCRWVLFPSFDGRIEYMDNGEVKGVSFRDSVDEDAANVRLRMALSPEGDWLRSVLGDANEELTRIRRDQPDAAGLVITMDQQHAHDVARLLEEVAGVRPVVAISDDRNSSTYIKAFRSGKDPWLVAVRMVSEGVDIPRLRVGVYATNITSEVFFRQALGRLIRMQPDYEDQTAYLFIPEDARLTTYAQQVKQERQHAIQDMDEYDLRGSRAESEGIGIRTLSLIEANALEGATIYDSDAYPPEELERARRFAQEAGVNLMGHRVDDVAVAKILRLAAPMTEEQRVAAQSAPAFYERRTRLRRMANRKVQYVAYLTKRDCQEVHKDLNFIDKKWASQRTEQELLASIAYLDGQIATAKQQQGGENA